jgi:hypothetical protein
MSLNGLNIGYNSDIGVINVRKIMTKRSVRYEVRLSEEERRWLTVIKSIYRINPADFIRDAIIEKMKQDVPKLREKKQKITMPF